MAKQRLDIYGRAHKLTRFLRDEELLPELAEDRDAVIASNAKILRQLMDEFGVRRDTALHALNDVIRDRRGQRKRRGDG